MTKTFPTRLFRTLPRPARLSLGIIAAATLLLCMPHAHAQAIDDLTRTATGHFNDAAAMGFNSVCWIVGGALFIIAIWGWYQHTRNPNAGTRMGMVFAGIVAGGLLLTLPFIVRTATFTLFGTSASVDGSQQMMRFDK